MDGSVPYINYNKLDQHDISPGNRTYCYEKHVVKSEAITSIGCSSVTGNFSMLAAQCY